MKVVLYVMAENASDACAAATRTCFEIFECAARKTEYVDPEWNDAIPYNADDDRTCAEIISNKPQTAHPETAIVKLPAYVEAAIRDFDQGNLSIQPGGQVGLPPNLPQVTEASAPRLMDTADGCSLYDGYMAGTLACSNRVSEC